MLLNSNNKSKIQMENITITPLEPNDTIRYLGVYFNGKVIFRNKQDEITFGVIVTHNRNSSFITNTPIQSISNISIITKPTETYTNIKSSNVYDPIDIKTSKSQDEITWHTNLDELSILIPFSSPTTTQNTGNTTINTNKLTLDEELLYNYLSETKSISKSILNNQSVINTNPIVIHCDGSYKKHNSSNTTMDIGWFIGNVTDMVIYSTEIMNQRKTAINAELLSVFHIMLAIPSKKK
nr:11803_t:CDS:2 [Entrophospora candida]